MYLKFYNLLREPFHITPDPEFLYLSDSHKQALGAILYGTKKKKGFVVITGAIGVGKTTVIRSFLAQPRSEDLKIVYIFNPNVSFEGLVRTVCQEMEVHHDGTDLFEALRNLHLRLIGEYKAGRNVVLIIDEAQNVPVETLENLRMLSNLETQTDKLIQIVLVGQPELDATLDRHELRQLKQRIALRAHIKPLSREESMAYIRHRISRAGGNTDGIFTGPALKLIVEKSGGIPRKLNILCDNSLINAFGCSRKPVGFRYVKEALVDLEPARRPFRSLPWRVASMALGVLLVVFLLFVFLRGYRAPGDRMWPQPVSAVSPLPVAQGDAAKAATVPGAKKEGEEKSAVEGSVQRPAGENVALVRTVQKGDTLNELLAEVYGTANSSLTRLVLGKNPQIRNAHRIFEGSTITFPRVTAVPEEERQNDTEKEKP